jgi:hypothetical protein
MNRDGNLMVVVAFVTIVVVAMRPKGLVGEAW